MKRSIGLLAVALAYVVGCKNANAVPPPPSFSGPGAMAFGCLDVTTEQDGSGAYTRSPVFVSLDLCKADDEGNIAGGYHQVVFVVQQNTGEVAAVDITGAQVLDSERIIPGFTLVEVGELPSGIAIPTQPNANGVLSVFVANLGTRSVQTISSTEFWYLFDPSTASMPTAPTLPLAGGPTDLALYEGPSSARFLYAPLPQRSEVAQIVVAADGSLSLGATLTIPVAPDPMPAPIAPPAPGSPKYERLCPTTTTDVTNPAVNSRDGVDPVPPRVVPPTAGVAPQPVRVRVVDGPTGRELLVADGALPFIYRFALTETGATPISPPIMTGVPISDFTVTPLVPPAFDPANQEVATEQYIYAIDATNDSVLVVDYGRNPLTFGAVLNVAVGDTTPDRIPLSGPAFHLDAVVSDYTLDADGKPVGACNVSGTDPDPDLALPTYLRGVFVAITTSDGSVRFADVFDLDATCRGGMSCVDPPVTGDERLTIRRHRLRIGGLFTRAPALVGAPSATFDTQSGNVQYDGTVSSLPQLALSPFTAGCPGAPAPVTNPTSANRMLQIYPDLSVAASSETQPLVCVLDDMNDGVGASWAAIYEGAIPNTTGTRGRLAVAHGAMSGQFFEAPDSSFCARGVLGPNPEAAPGGPALGPDDPETGYEGDMLVLLSALPWSTQDAEACAAFETQSDGSRAFLAFPILATHDGPNPEDKYLELGAAISPDVLDVDFALARRCFPDTVTYSVNTYGAFTVSAVGPIGPAFRHRVVTSTSTGACVVDTANFPVNTEDPDSYHNGRARFGHAFIHPQVAFALAPYPDASLPIPHGISGRLAFATSNTPSPLRIDAALLPEAIRFSSTFNQLYVVDGQLNQMVALGVRPVARVATLR